jgi:hypothetical protein
MSVQLTAAGRHEPVESSSVAGTRARQPLGFLDKVGGYGHGTFWRTTRGEVDLWNTGASAEAGTAPSAIPASSGSSCCRPTVGSARHRKDSPPGRAGSSMIQWLNDPAHRYARRSNRD